jgi:tryptophan synthase alpha chain
MTVISDRFANLRSQQQCALIPFITAGDPSLAITASALRCLNENGADFIELGVPYSDPLADGPVIQAAATRALKHGTRLNDVLAIVQEVSPELQAPIILFTYYNPILNRGVEPFVQALATAGVSGLVVPDLPLEESAALAEMAAQFDIDLI